MRRFFKRFTRYIPWAAGLVVLLLMSACAKADFGGYFDVAVDTGTEAGLAIGTVRSQDGIRYIRLDEKSCSQVMNPKEIADIKDGTRVFLQFRYVVAASIAEFCTDAILVEWASPLDMGEIRYEMIASAGDPVEILTDWITSLEDGFLTLHYVVQASGNVKHEFSLYPSAEPNAYRLVHDARGDVKGTRTDGIVCFDVAGVLPDTEGETATLHLDYIDLNHTQKRLTVEYQSPK